MCDYSLMHVKSRAAKVGDKLVTSSFPNASSKGFAAVGEPDVAVCVLPGTEIAFNENVRKKAIMFGTDEHEIPHKVARFRQINLEAYHMHHDALEFPDGSQVLLHSLASGQTATILQLPAAPKNQAEAQEQKRLEVVG